MIFLLLYFMLNFNSSVAGTAASKSFLTDLLGGFKLYMDNSGNVIDTSGIIAVSLNQIT